MDPNALPKNYQPQDWEGKLYSLWDKSGFFNPDECIKAGVTKADAEPFSVLMPPPNVTGILHLGHAMENSIMDVMARYKRMAGCRTLFLPGADHAAVATQARVEKSLIEEGIANPRQELGREKLLEKIRAYADQSKETIIKQVRAMGSSADWSRFAYTFDDARVRAVNAVFKKMYDDGLIYKGYRVVNWSVKGQSTASDDELVHVKRPAKLYTLRYSKDFPIPIATTRPETKLGDTAVAVHPDDARYQQYIGQTFTADVGAKNPLGIKVIGDESVDPEFGTGAVGVTPAHSQADFDMYERHGDIALIQVIGQDGKMNENAGTQYEGLTVEAAREKFVSWLRENSLLENEEDIVQSVGTSDRFGDVAEVLPMHQWFIHVEKEIPGRGKTLKDLMREAVTVGHDGNPDQKVSIQPERFTKIYLHWIENLRPWCISRQIWWGHRIPVWYRGEEICCGTEAPEGAGWEQDPDTLDTWFSSGLWTFSALGWPDETEDLRTFHPTSFMQMGHEILFFWMARMILMTTYVLDTIPFREVYIHGILRDEHGKKFSKSLGNGIDPIEAGKQYGTDAIRLTLLSDITPGNDSRFSFDKLESGRNFVNKLWNIARYILSSSETVTADPLARSSADHWILERLAATRETVTKHLEAHQFSLATEALREFTRDDFADWYVEIHKIEKNDALLRFVLETLLCLWHPFIPFVSEAIWSTLGKETLLMVTAWPEAIPLPSDKAQAERFRAMTGLVKGIRALRSVYRIDPAQPLDITASGKSLETLRENEALFKRLARIETLHDAPTAPKHSALVQSESLQAFVHLEGAIDIEKETARLKNDQANLEKNIRGLEARLADPLFTKKAPEHILANTRELLARNTEELRNVEEALKNLTA